MASLLEPLVQFFEKLITQFSWRRLIFVTVFLILCGGLMALYETYTGQFRLRRIDRSTRLLAALTELAPKVSASEDEQAKKIFRGLEADLEEYINHRATGVDIPPTFLKFITAAIPWALLILLLFSARAQGVRDALLGAIALAIPCLVIAIVLPSFSRSWINYILYPIASCALVVMATAAWDKRKKRRAVSSG